MKVSLYTLGCNLNQSESEALADAFVKQGFTLVSSQDEADLYLVNTCTVTSKSEQKARRMIRKFSRNEHTPVVVATGCYAQMDPEELSKLWDALVVVPMSRKSSLLKLPLYIAERLIGSISLQEIVENFFLDQEKELMLNVEQGPSESVSDATGNNQTEFQQASLFDYSASTFQYHARAFLKIEDGCDNSCAYCRVTLARGPAVSLNRTIAIERALRLEAEGYREIVLTGVNITAYSSEGEGLEGLITELLNKLTSARIRPSSIEPDHLTYYLVKYFAHPLVQPHVHIPVQSGSDAILARIGRHNSVSGLLEGIARIRTYCPDPFIAADVIAGLPGETDLDHKETCSVLKQAGFSRIHVFPYSPRPGTQLYHAQDKVPEYLRDERAHALRILSEQLYADYCSRWNGRTVSAIVEKKGPKGLWSGLTENYLQLSIAGIPAAAGDLRRQRVKVLLQYVEGKLLGTFCGMLP